MTQCQDCFKWLLDFWFKPFAVAVAPRPVESMMPPPPAPVAAQPAPSVVAPPGGTVTRQSAMNPQGLIEISPYISSFFENRHPYYSDRRWGSCSSAIKCCERSWTARKKSGRTTSTSSWNQRGEKSAYEHGSRQRNSEIFNKYNYFFFVCNFFNLFYSEHF